MEVTVSFKESMLLDEDSNPIQYVFVKTPTHVYTIGREVNCGDRVSVEKRTINPDGEDTTEWLRYHGVWEGSYEDAINYVFKDVIKGQKTGH